MNTITYTDTSRTITLNTEEVMARLGSEATPADAAMFIKTWNTRFFDEAPDFTNDDDGKDASWQETLELAGLA